VPPVPDRDAVVEFLRRWGATVLVACYYDRKQKKPLKFHRYEPGGEEEAVTWAIEQNGEKRNIYFHVGETAPGFVGKAKKEHVTSSQWVHCDVDPRAGENLEEERVRILGALKGYAPPPTVIIDSGRGYQGFWRLKEAVALEGDVVGRIAEFERMSRAIEIALGSDNVFNVDRVMKIPGMVAWPDEKKATAGAVPRVAAVVDWDDSRIYDPAGLEKAPPLTASTGTGTGSGAAVRIEGTAEPVEDALTDPRLKDIPGWCREIIVNGKILDDDDPKRVKWSRSDWQWWCSCEMVRCGVDPEVHFAVLMDSDLGLWPTVRDHGGAKYARRQVERATERARAFVTNEEGKVLTSSYANIRLALLKIGAQFSYDEFSDKYIVTGIDGIGPAVDDPALVRMHRLVQESFAFLAPKKQFDNAVIDLCREAPFHPVRVYLDGLTWDGKGRIDTWLIDYAGVEDTSYARAVGRIFLLAGVRRVRQPGCRFGKMLILEGSQGKGKSTLLRSLMPNPDWFQDDVPLSGKTQEIIEVTRGKWLLEEAELSTFGHAAVEKLKAAITRQTDRARMAYARMVTDVPRQFIMAGSTNEERYLEDKTGNIRFWPVRTSGALKVEELVKVRDALWAEAAAREAAGESIDLDESLWDAARGEQEKRESVDPWEEALEAALPPGGGKILSDDLYTFVGVEIEKRDRRAAHRLGKIMRKMGYRYENQRFGQELRKCWFSADGTLTTLHVEICGMETGHPTRSIKTATEAPF